MNESDKYGEYDADLSSVIRSSLNILLDSEIERSFRSVDRVHSASNADLISELQSLNAMATIAFQLQGQENEWNDKVFRIAAPNIEIARSAKDYCAVASCHQQLSRYLISCGKVSEALAEYYKAQSAIDEGLSTHLNVVGDPISQEDHIQIRGLAYISLLSQRKYSEKTIKYDLIEAGYTEENWPVPIDLNQVDKAHLLSLNIQQLLAAEQFIQADKRIQELESMIPESVYPLSPESEIRMYYHECLEMRISFHIANKEIQDAWDTFDKIKLPGVKQYKLLSMADDFVMNQEYGQAEVCVREFARNYIQIFTIDPDGNSLSDLFRLAKAAMQIQNCGDIVQSCIDGWDSEQVPGMMQHVSRNPESEYGWEQIFAILLASGQIERVSELLTEHENTQNKTSDAIKAAYANASTGQDQYPDTTIISQISDTKLRVECLGKLLKMKYLHHKSMQNWQGDVENYSIEEKIVTTEINRLADPNLELKHASISLGQFEAVFTNEDSMSKKRVFTSRIPGILESLALQAAQLADWENFYTIFNDTRLQWSNRASIIYSLVDLHSQLK